VENAKKPGDSNTPVASVQNSDGPTVMVPLKDLMAGAKSSATPPVDEEGATTTIDLKQVLGADLQKARAEILARLDSGGAAPAPARPASEPGAAAEQPDILSQKTLQSEPIPALPEPQTTPPVPAPTAEAAYSGDATIVSTDLARPQSPSPPLPPAPMDAGDATVVDMKIPSAPAAAASVPLADVDATVIGAALPPPPKPAAAPKPAPAAGGFWGNAPGGAGAKAPGPTAAPPNASAAPVPPKPAAPPPAPPPAPKAAAPVPPPPAAKPTPPPAPAAAPVQVPAPVVPAPATVSPQPDAAASGGSRALRLIVWLVIIIGAIAAGAYFMLKDYEFEDAAVVNVTPAPVAEEQPVDVPPPTVPPLAEFSGGLTSTTPVVLAQVPVEPQVAPPAAATSDPAPRPARKQSTPSPRAVREVAPEEPVAPQEQTPPAPPPAAEGDLVHIDQPGVTPPRLTTDEPARYPVRARMAGAKGTVTLSLLIDHQGRVAEATVARSAGNDLLDNSAILAAKKSVYSPAMKDGARVRVWISRDYTFQP
jgi:TonB family protein